MLTVHRILPLPKVGAARLNLVESSIAQLQKKQMEPLAAAQAVPHK
jgi:hypothetical protein